MIIWVGWQAASVSDCFRIRKGEFVLWVEAERRGFRRPAPKRPIKKPLTEQCLASKEYMVKNNCLRFNSHLCSGEIVRGILLSLPDGRTFLGPFRSSLMEGLPRRLWDAEFWPDLQKRLSVKGPRRRLAQKRRTEKPSWTESPIIRGRGQDILQGLGPA